MRIVQVSTRDVAGGAEKMARALFSALRDRGHESRLAVGQRLLGDPDTFVLPNSEASGWWSRFWWARFEHLRAGRSGGRWKRLATGAAHRLAEPASWLEHWRGIEDFNFPGTWRLGRCDNKPVDILNCHNLHGDYFDLRALPYLSRQTPVILTPHDAWLLSGHCAHSLACQRWKSGCGCCPDLTLYPAVKRDNTARNWQTKRSIYQNSRLYVTTQSRWLLDQVERSILAPAVAASRVIPTGIDLHTFRPGDKRAAREALQLPPDAQIVLFAANYGRRNSYKDYSTIESAVATVAQTQPADRLLLVALGDSGPAIAVDSAGVRSVPYISDPALVARYYQSADVYLHAAKADTFPQVVLEAMACGIPVIATAVGGITEQVVDGQTGLLTLPGSADHLAAALQRLLTDAAFRIKLGHRAAEIAHQLYDLDRQTDDYLSFYQAAIDDFRRRQAKARDA